MNGIESQIDLVKVAVSQSLLVAALLEHPEYTRTHDRSEVIITKCFPEVQEYNNDTTELRGRHRITIPLMFSGRAWQPPKRSRNSEF